MPDGYIILVNTTAKDIVFNHEGREHIFIGLDKTRQNPQTHTHIPEEIGRAAQAVHPELQEIRLKGGKFVKV